MAYFFSCHFSHSLSICFPFHFSYHPFAFCFLPFSLALVLFRTLGLSNIYSFTSISPHSPHTLCTLSPPSPPLPCIKPPHMVNFLFTSIVATMCFFFIVVVKWPLQIQFTHIAFYTAYNYPSIHQIVGSFDWALAFWFLTNNVVSVRED